MTTTISPTVGRIVWFNPNGQYFQGMRQLGEQPMAAQVAFVHRDTCVNLLVTDHIGRQHAAESVHLMQDGGPTLASGQAFCEWMPYQKGQAAKDANPMLVGQAGSLSAT